MKNIVLSISTLPDLFFYVYFYDYLFSLLLINIKKLIKEKKIDESIEKLKLLDEYENFFFNTIEQSKIYIEFNKNLMELI